MRCQVCGRPKLLDAFSGEGGAGKGYMRAREVEKALAHPSYGLGVEGTWAGVLYRDGRRVTTGRGVQH